MSASKQLLIPVLAFFCASASGDIISGKVTDLAGNTPLAGVKVSLSASLNTLSDANGAYSLNTSPTGLNAVHSGSLIRWDARTGSFQWDGNEGVTAVEVRDIRGHLADGISFFSAAPHSYTYSGNTSGIHLVAFNTVRGTFRFRMAGIGNLTWVVAEQPAMAAAGTALAKAAPAANLTYEKTGYDPVTRQVNGSQANVDVQLAKTGTLRKANLTWFESYPDPGSAECLEFNGCKWAGQFAALDGKQPESWVKANNIVAVHQRDFSKYKLKTLRLRQGTRQIDVKVYDMCADSDCNGCCTQNAAATGFLIDIEKYTAERFGTNSGTVDWNCLDC